MKKELKDYPSTEKFKVIDTVPVPHPYCITTGHVAEAADNFCGSLGEAAILSAEKKGIKCGICNGVLPYKKHKTALLVEVDDTRDLNDIPDLKDYLLSIKERTKKDGYAGFAFILKKGAKK